MTDSVTILVPVWNRPARVESLLRSLDMPAPFTRDIPVLFIASDGDKREIAAIRKAQRQRPTVQLLIVDGPAGGPGDYARKINRGVLAVGGDWLFQGADDLAFKHGWLDACLNVHERTGCRVIGTNDLCNPRTRTGRHSTHSLVHRSWVEEGAVWDQPGQMLHEGYWHNFVDDELLATARLHREFAHAASAHVQHLHPNCGTAELDATYERALDTRQFSRDRQLLNQRVREMRRGRRRPVLRRPPEGDRTDRRR